MPLPPLIGHTALRRRLRHHVARDALPASLLIHGPRGTGKQRLALWLAQLLLCRGGDERPCGQCHDCHLAAQVAHPDLYWIFPRARGGDGDASPDDMLADTRAAAVERAAGGGMYAAPDGGAGIYIATVRMLLREAGRTPAMGARKVFVVGDAERMIVQEGAESAANAFLKVLEEPQADTVLILTSSEPAALLPTIRSRVIALRTAPLAGAEVRELLAHPAVSRALDAAGLPASLDERVRRAAGAPGQILSAGTADAGALAGALLAAAEGAQGERIRAVAALGGTPARGGFRDVLDGLTALLHERARRAAERADAPGALAAARAVAAAETARERAAGNVNPQLAGAALLRELAELFA